MLGERIKDSTVELTGMQFGVSGRGGSLIGGDGGEGSCFRG